MKISKGNRISDRTLEQLRLGELTEAESKSLLEALEKGGEMYRLDALIDADERFLARYPSDIAAEHIASRIPIPEDLRKKEVSMLSSKSNVFLWTTLVGTAVIALLFFATQSGDTSESAEIAVQNPGPSPVPKTEASVESEPAPTPEEIRLAERQTYFDQALITAGITTSTKKKRIRLQAILDEYEDAGVTIPDRSKLAEAQFELADVSYRKLISLSLDEADEKTLKVTLSKRKEFSETAEDAYWKVAAFNVPKWNAAAHFRIGKIYLDQAQAIRESFVPPNLNATQKVKYQKILEDPARSLEGQALQSFTMASMARTGEYAKEARLELVQLDRRLRERRTLGDTVILAVNETQKFRLRSGKLIYPVNYPVSDGRIATVEKNGIEIAVTGKEAGSTTMIAKMEGKHIARKTNGNPKRVSVRVGSRIPPRIAYNPDGKEPSQCIDGMGTVSFRAFGEGKEVQDASIVFSTVDAETERCIVKAVERLQLEEPETKPWIIELTLSGKPMVIGPNGQPMRSQPKP